MLHAVEAPVTQNAKEFESGDNFHLQPAAIWSKAHTTEQKWRKTDNLLKSLYFSDWIKVVKIELCLMNADQMSIYFRFIKGKVSSLKLKDVRLSDLPIWVY